MSGLGCDEDQALDPRQHVMPPGRHDAGEAVGLARANSLIPANERISPSTRPLFWHLEEKHARPGRLGVFKAGVHPLDRL
jgi:hypothetical protein